MPSRSANTDGSPSSPHSSSSSSLTTPLLPQSNTSSSENHKTIRKRNRVPLSCNFCRQRKLKCNRGHPCENCNKRGDESGCVYLEGHNGTNLVNQMIGQKFSVSGISANNKRATGAELRNRLDKLENLVLGYIYSLL